MNSSTNLSFVSREGNSLVVVDGGVAEVVEGLQALAALEPPAAPQRGGCQCGDQQQRGVHHGGCERLAVVRAFIAPDKIPVMMIR